MINKAMGSDERLVELAEKIDYRYQHLWAVYKSYRKLPLEPMINLCKLLGIDEGKAARLYLEQPEPTKSEYDRKKAS
jgi:dihydrodipicolinate synthase/N-acetylneuraminate lyase